eukprot:Rmarinus@m.24421
MLVLYQSMVIPFRIAFEIQLSLEWQVFDYIIDSFFAIDIFMHFNTAYVSDTGETVTDRKLVANHYMRGFFVLDLLSTLPFDLMQGSVSSGTARMNKLLRSFRILRLFKLLRMMRMEALLREYGEVYSINANMMKITKLVFWIVVLSHLGACAWHAIVVWEGTGTNWIEEYKSDFCSDTSDDGEFSCGVLSLAASKYLVSLYWMLTTMTTVGYGDVIPQTDLERAVALFFVVVGATVFAYIVGNVSSLMANVNQAESVRNRKMEMLNDFMNYRRLPPELKRRVRKYCEFVWAQQSAFDEEKIMSDLSLNLREEVALFMNKELIDMVPLFKNAPKSFITSIVTHLRPLRVMPGEYIIREGELSHDMYLIKNGEVEVLKKTDTDEFLLLRRMSGGSYFGEIGILADTVVRRTSSVIAVSPCELYALSKADLADALAPHPKLRDVMKADAEVRMKNTFKNSKHVVSRKQPAGASRVRMFQAHHRSPSIYHRSVCAREASPDRHRHSPMSDDDSDDAPVCTCSHGSGVGGRRPRGDCRRSYRTCAESDDDFDPWRERGLPPGPGRDHEREWENAQRHKWQDDGADVDDMLVSCGSARAQTHDQSPITNHNHPGSSVQSNDMQSASPQAPPRSSKEVELPIIEEISSSDLVPLPGCPTDPTSDFPQGRPAPSVFLAENQNSLKGGDRNATSQPALSDDVVSLATHAAPGTSPRAQPGSSGAPQSTVAAPHASVDLTGTAVDAATAILEATPSQSTLPPGAAATRPSDAGGGADGVPSQDFRMLANALGDVKSTLRAVLSFQRRLDERISIVQDATSRIHAHQKYLEGNLDGRLTGVQQECNRMADEVLKVLRRNT